MSSETAKQRAQELTRKALLEADKETYKVDRSLRGKHIETKSEKAAKEKEYRRIEKEMRGIREKSSILVSMAGVLEKVLHTIVTLFTMAIVINIFFVWQIYKTVSANGWHGIFQTKYTLFVVLYFVLLLVLKRGYLLLYKYANE